MVLKPGWKGKLKSAQLKQALERGRQGEVVYLTGHNLARANLHVAELRGADIGEADLTGATLTFASLDRANLNGASLERANLDSASLTGTSLRQANLDYAILTSVVLNDANLTKASLRYANLHDAMLNRAILCEADFTEAILTNNVMLTEANLSQAKLNKADLEGANLYEAILDRADLSGANLTEADLEGADLSNANLTETDLKGADLTKANFTGATVTDEQIFRAKTLKDTIMPDGRIVTREDSKSETSRRKAIEETKARFEESMSAVLDESPVESEQRAQVSTASEYTAANLRAIRIAVCLVGFLFVFIIGNKLVGSIVSVIVVGHIVTDAGKKWKSAIPYMSWFLLAVGILLIFWSGIGIKEAITTPTGLVGITMTIGGIIGLVVALLKFIQRL